MKKMSVKKKILGYLVLLMIVLSLLLVVVTTFISKRVVLNSQINQVSDVIKDNANYINEEDGIIIINSKFHYSYNGITTLIYSKEQSLISGQVPIHFKYNGTFQNGKIHQVEIEDNHYLFVDLYVPTSLTNGYWLRSITTLSDTSMISKEIIKVSAFLLPIFILVVGLGSYLIIKKSFEPLDQLNELTQQINEAKDLSARLILEDHEDEFTTLGHHFNELLERLETLFHSEIQFTSDASHELRTPVAIIKSACEYSLKYDETDEERKETIEMIDRQITRMTKLIESLLTITRMEIGTRKINTTTFELKELIEDIHAFYPDQNNIEIKEVCDVKIKGDHELLQSVINNLIDNALKYGSRDQPIELSATEDEQYALLQVRDHGIGIDQEHLPYIFNRFYQVDPSRKENNGSGLGLSIVKEIIDLHQGTIEVESIVEKGTTFIIKLNKYN